MPYPKVVSLRYTQEVGETVLIVGCGDNQIRTYDAKGHLLNAYYTYATVPDAVEVTDIDGDGVTEVMAAGKTESSSGTFYVHDIKEIRTKYRRERMAVQYSISRVEKKG